MPASNMRLLPRDRSLRAGLAGCVLTLIPIAAVAGTPTTAQRTIGDANGDNRLEAMAGEAYAVREDIAPAAAGRGARRSPRLTFAQFTDTHIVDEESPLRVEFLDAVGSPLNGAYRAQEGLSTQVMNEMIRDVRWAVSPATGQSAALLIMTGDNSDNTQRNEVRWVIDTMDGGAIDPNSGVAGSCRTTSDGHLYDGVRGSGAYYEPDASGGQDGRGYSPSQAENQAAVSRSNSMRDYPGLYEAMNRPFQATGLGLPWYAVFGNHDVLLQGNQPRRKELANLATGCVKVTKLSAAAQAQLGGLLEGGLTDEEIAQAAKLVTDDMMKTASVPALRTALARTVPSDPKRAPLKKVEFMTEHFTTRGKPVGHGFTQDDLASGQGNYSFSPKPGIRFVVLDSINEAGYSDGNIDNAQFLWLHAQLLDAETQHQLVFAFAHHSLRTMNQPAASPFPPGDTGGNRSPIVHFGLGPNGQVAPCSQSGPQAKPTLDETVRCLFLRHPSLIAFVDGHEHLNHIAAYPPAAGAPGGFWEVTSASHIDWPQQSRLLDLVDNRDGTLSIFTTMLDHTPLLRPTGVPASAVVDEAGVRQLAGISRELSYNDPQADNGEDGHSDARGTALDRNAELVVRNPYAP